MGEVVEWNMEQKSEVGLEAEEELKEKRLELEYVMGEREKVLKKAGKKG